MSGARYNSQCRMATYNSLNGQYCAIQVFYSGEEDNGAVLARAQAIHEQSTTDEDHIMLGDLLCQSHRFVVFELLRNFLVGIQYDSGSLCVR
jgi:hypothetical protein